jgi:protein phosphatase
VESLLRSGVLTAEEASNHPSAHLLTKCLGAADEDAFEVSSLEADILRGQEILLCSDGLSDELSDEQISKILVEGGSEQERVDKLIQAAIEAGGRDNISVILVSAPRNAPRTYSSNAWLTNLLYLVVGAGVGCLLLLITYYMDLI